MKEEKKTFKSETNEKKTHTFFVLVNHPACVSYAGLISISAYRHSDIIVTAKARQALYWTLRLRAPHRRGESECPALGASGL